MCGSHKNMLLTIDIGNTEITVGIFNKNELLFELRFGTPKNNPEKFLHDLFLELITKHPELLKEKTEIAVSSVVPSVASAFETAQKKYFPSSHAFYVTYKCKSNVELAVAKPETIGADLIANAVAAHHKYPTDLIVVDLGTATTFQLITYDGKFIGSSFFPGLNISANALFEQAEKLKSIEIKKPRSVIGTNTEECLQSGLYYGYAGMVDSLIKKIEKEYGKKTTAILTGGLSNVIIEAVETDVIHEKFLTLDGIRILYEMALSTSTPDERFCLWHN